MIKPVIKYITDCRTRDLVRFTDDKGTFWALVGVRSNEMLILLKLPANGSPFCENIMGHMDILRPPFEGLPVLSYGTNYSIRVDHAGGCEIGETGKLISAHGSYVMHAKDEELICCRYAKKTAYYDLKTGQLRSEPGKERAVFAHWDLVLKDEPQTKLFDVRANTSPAIVAVPIVVTAPSATTRFDNRS